ncbi:isoleucyl-tRNA synthetase [Pedobacter psychrotolerans]|uniref:Isoleucine--tRNA ligase n=1 Tax=Pedobacter psychrotolerans TaxID=1843235 RepID=A0A4R2HAB3_9SPHI|nr:isoleucine--tRNA ligase [Pedobacter psychrotolerans]TCO23655.1 isoleucyl-tRNA synthetase [Pedobacter psychrotolerans]GGE61602.1 isoleucine--tRNA ligase [Pedobacter psychrotolerans]
MYSEFKQLELAKIGQEILDFWKKENIFEKSISSRPKSNPFTFYEGPPSANGMPGIHHVMARAIKDIFCRYKTLKGYQVKRKGGWDTHGLPIELAVEKKLGITKEDIGKKISVDEYNAACRTEVMRYTDVWNDLTEKMGYWVDLENPYITYENDYIETLWWILKQLYNKGYLYKGYTVQPYSPAAGTGLSSHELNQPGTYKDVSDTTIVAQFKAINETLPEALSAFGTVHFLAWTTTPWTLPSNTALTVGPKIDYVLVKSFNQYTFEPIQVVLAKALVGKQFAGKYFLSENGEDFNNFKADDKKIPYTILGEFAGADLVGIKYEQLLPYALPYQNAENAFRVISGDFVTTEDGTGIVHTAPTFGADDARVAKLATPEVPPMLVLDEKGNAVPLVDLQGKFIASLGGNYGGKYVKNEYYKDGEAPDKSVDVELAIQLKEENKAFKVEKYVHTYPHCWRTDKPVLYYPLDSWFIKTTAVKDKMVELNKTINWKPESTGTGRFGNWLENLVDWNLSRSRYWGTPLPIWRTADGLEEKCIGSIAELNTEIAKSIEAGFMPAGFELKDMHRPYVDDVILISSKGEKMTRETDLIDVWFDSGAMPYAQWHFPFENKEEFANAYAADFIAEGVDQTRGWFFTLHALAVMLSEASDEIKEVNTKTGNPGVAFKNVVSNGLVLDKNGNKMSKRLGNAVDPFSTIETYSADATRWYMISNASPWDNLKFSLEGLDEVRRKFFGTLYNTYAFFALYANIDKFEIDKNNLSKVADRTELDRWILSLLQNLINEVDEAYNTYEPTKASRAIQTFVDEHLSNWYIRLSRRRFWKGEMTDDKRAAYETLYTCLETLSQLMSPVAPFFADWLYRNLTVTDAYAEQSVHLTLWNEADQSLIDYDLNERMVYAQDISSMVLSLRKKSSINVRQPLEKILIPSLNGDFERKISKVADYILSETNVKHIEFITDTHGIVKKKLKPNFKSLGKKVGKDMSIVKEALENMTQDDIQRLEVDGYLNVFGSDNIQHAIDLNDDVEVFAEDIPGWQVTNLGNLTVALDVTISEELKQEGLSRELVNRIQNLRKELNFEVTDRIKVALQNDNLVATAVAKNKAYICAEILADEFELTDTGLDANKITIDDVELSISVTKI